MTQTLEGEATEAPATEPATASSRRRRPLSFEARLMMTIVAIVSAILVTISIFMTIVLNNVLESQLNENVTNTARTAAGMISRDVASGADAVASLDGMPIEPGFLFVLQDPAGAYTGAVVGSDRYIARLNDAQIQDALSHAGPAGHLSTASIDDLGGYRIVTLDGPQKALMGLPTAEMQSTIGKMWTTILFATLGGMVLLGVATTVVVRRGLRPLRAVAMTAARVARQPLDQGTVSIQERVPADEADPRTEIGQVGASLNTLLDHVETSLHARQRNEELMRRFVADASHELRTPLASIRGYSELSLRDRDLTPTTEQALERIQAQSVRMTSLVEDLLLLARLDEGQEIVLGAVDLTQLAVETLADQQAAGPEHHWSVEVPEQPVIIAGDRGRLTQVVVNLLANARTHTPPGSDVVLRVEQRGTGGASRAILRVTDNGPGIPTDIQETLFTRFIRADASRARKTGGTGLGLSIAKAIVEAHHGTIRVESAPGQTSFIVDLPAKPV